MQMADVGMSTVSEANDLAGAVESGCHILPEKTEGRRCNWAEWFAAEASGGRRQEEDYQIFSVGEAVRSTSNFNGKGGRDVGREEFPKKINFSHFKSGVPGFLTNIDFKFP